ncbi:MAG TPA: sigma-70 family RNA polymerase sigma factor [Acidimicrobiales bacterium]|nr:sigma-70 family RNA polymerase sigma factor [Acidimicrobiales bacterium]
MLEEEEKRVSDVVDAAPSVDGMHREYATTRDPRLRSALLEHYQSYARAIAARYGHSNAGPDDLEQVALLGVLKAIDRFDPERGVSFSTFAWATTHGELKRHLRDSGWSARVPRRVKEVFLVVNRTADDLTLALGRSPTVAEIAQTAGISDEEVVEAMAAQGAYRPDSVDRRAEEWEPSERELGFEEVEVRSELVSVIRRLQPQQQELLRLRFAEELSQTEIAARLGTSQMQVSRMLSAVLGRLRRQLAP